MEIINIYRSTA